MGLLDNLFSFRTATGEPKKDVLGSSASEAQKAKKDRIKIESQIELTNGILNNSLNTESKLRRPLIG